ncbi:hypothetical protein [Rhizobium sp. SL42]|uniref:hypothetical protein n=1 Tax=Rhizobium sp. SL42 TaxID=2806346 RepID=UPI001F2749EC|nr:hypothetical protein [Rhizobium sp. SL42]UJW77567.1 hypothetical protein IM739_23340 [Rhizobium sp. SL42]
MAKAPLQANFLHCLLAHQIQRVPAAAFQALVGGKPVDLPFDVEQGIDPVDYRVMLIQFSFRRGTVQLEKFVYMQLT